MFSSEVIIAENHVSLFMRVAKLCLRRHFGSHVTLLPRLRDVSLLLIGGSSDHLCVHGDLVTARASSEKVSASNQWRRWCVTMPFDWLELWPVPDDRSPAYKKQELAPLVWKRNVPRRLPESLSFGPVLKVKYVTAKLVLFSCSAHYLIYQWVAFLKLSLRVAAKSYSTRNFPGFHHGFIF